VALVTVNLFWGCTCLLAGFIAGYLMRVLQSKSAGHHMALNAARSEATVIERTEQLQQLQDRARKVATAASDQSPTARIVREKKS